MTLRRIRSLRQGIAPVEPDEIQRMIDTGRD